MDCVNKRAPIEPASARKDQSRRHHSHELSSPVRTPCRHRHHRHSYSPYSPPRVYYPSQFAHTRPPSSPDIQFEPTEDPTLFPRVENWLSSLDEGPRGSDGDYFTQYAPLLISNGYKRLFHLARPGFSTNELRRICGQDNMTEGLAATILDYARADTSKIVADETRRRRKRQYESRRYV